MRVPTYTAEQVRAAEAPLLAAGVPLMRRAAHALAGVIAERDPERMLVLVGAGDNGGDALYAAAELAARGIHVDILRTAERVHEPALAAATAEGARLITDPLADAYDLVVDGILGIGARGGLRGAARNIVRALRPGHPTVIAVDLPSGLDPDTGETDGVVLPAATTITFGAVKAGLALAAGPRLCGSILLVDIGLQLDPATAVGRAAISAMRQG